MSVRQSVKSIPVVGPVLRSARDVVDRRRFPGSAAYWQQRYREGGNSGAGSYGEVARYKAGFLNRFVDEHGVGSVIEFGCGDGHQLSLATYPAYVGLDVAPAAVDLCIARHGHDPTRSFLLYDPARFVNHGALQADMAVSLDVILHLVEDDVLESYLRHLSGAATRYLVFFTEDGKESLPGAHLRFRNVADWSPMLDGWRLTETYRSPVQGPDSLADFFVFEH